MSDDDKCYERKIKQAIVYTGGRGKGCYLGWSWQGDSQDT